MFRTQASDPKDELIRLLVAKRSRVGVRLATGARKAVPHCNLQLLCLGQCHLGGMSEPARLLAVWLQMAGGDPCALTRWQSNGVFDPALFRRERAAGEGGEGEGAPPPSLSAVHAADAAGASFGSHV